MNETKQDEELVFRYSRENRLKHADQSVQMMNEPKSKKKTTLFGTLTATKSLAFLFLAILMLSATVMVTHFLMPDSNEKEYKGNRLTLSAFHFEGATYVALKKKAKAGAYFGPARLFVRIGGSQSFALITDIVVSNKEYEEFKFKLQEVGDKFEAVLNVEDKVLLLKANTQ
ncbi:MAG: hypothetical protein WCT14_03770 [Treponemataceae bacterium]